MRLLPRSLFGRLTLVLMGGLLLAQLLTAAVHLEDRFEALYHTTGLHAARRIGNIVRVLDTLPRTQRHAVAAALSGPLLRVSLSDHRPENEAVPPGSARQQFITRLLHRHLGDSRPVHLTVLEDGRALEPPPPPPPGRGRGWHGPGRGMMHGPGRRPPFSVDTRLVDGQWVRFVFRPPEETTAWPVKLLLVVGVLALSVVLVSLLAVRWVTRPLTVLADAADELGRDIHRPPVSEDGPTEVARAARAFNRMQQRVARYVDERSRFLAAVSHDLKTPITRLRLRAEFLEPAAMREKLSADLTEMEAMLDATLELIRGEDEHETPCPVDLLALLETLQLDEEEIGHKVSVSGALEAPYVGRPLALKRGLGNLIRNAVVHGGSADVHLEDNAERARVRIRDHGPGIPDAHLERVFEPFYRVDPSRSRRTGGSGLGLAIARNVVNLHGGTLTLRNHPEGGLVAELVLPR